MIFYAHKIRRLHSEQGQCKKTYNHLFGKMDNQIQRLSHQRFLLRADEPGFFSSPIVWPTSHNCISVHLEKIGALFACSPDELCISLSAPEQSSRPLGSPPVSVCIPHGTFDPNRSIRSHLRKEMLFDRSRFCIRDNNIDTDPRLIRQSPTRMCLGTMISGLGDSISKTSEGPVLREGKQPENDPPLLDLTPLLPDERNSNT